MQVNKISLNNINPTSSMKQNNHAQLNLSFKGDSFKKSNPKTENTSYSHNLIIDLQSKIVIAEAKKIREKGIEMRGKAENLMLTSGIHFSEATRQFESASDTLNEIKQSGKGIMYHNNDTIKAVINNGMLIEFDADRNLLRESIYDDDGIYEVNYLDNDKNKRATKTKNGLKVSDNVRYLKNDIKVADKVYDFNNNGDLMTYQEGYISKIGKHSIQKSEVQFNYDRNILTEALLNSSRKDDKYSSGLRILYSTEGDVIKAEKGVVFKNGRKASTSERYVFSKNPEDNSILKSFDKFSDETMHAKGKRRHIEYGINNKVLYSSKY